MVILQDSSAILSDFTMFFVYICILYIADAQPVFHEYVYKPFPIPVA